MVKTNNYADFKLIANGLGVSMSVFYFDGGSAFQAIGVSAGLPVISLTLGSAKPGAFNTDYPSAVALSNFIE
jgi:hypothetical protein